MKSTFQAIVFYIALFFIYLASSLPFAALYILSDTLYFFLAKVFHYRQKVILKNLRNSFPEKSEEEIMAIADLFYKFLCDLMLETLKMLTISKAAIVKRCKISSPELLEKLYKEKRSVIIVMGHYGNWEWANAIMAIKSNYVFNAIYKPLSNRYFDRLFINIRSRFGTNLISMHQTLRSFIDGKNIITATAFLADQTSVPDHSYWTSFLHQDTPVFLGTERIAKKYNQPVIFCYFDRVKRGYYEIFYELLIDNPENTMPGEISELYTRRLEDQIIKKPHLWLWSHNKWKHKKKG